MEILEKVQPHQIYAAGDLSDPHGTHRVCLAAIYEALKRAKELDVDGVSLESCFFPSYDEGWLRDLKAQLDGYGMDRVYAWGHPDGLERGEGGAHAGRAVTVAGVESFRGP